MASFGYILSARNQKHGLPVLQTNAYGRAYGALFMLVAVVLADKPFSIVDGQEAVRDIEINDSKRWWLPLTFPTPFARTIAVG
jgi:hypothetical protein